MYGSSLSIKSISTFFASAAIELSIRSAIADSSEYPICRVAEMRVCALGGSEIVFIYSNSFSFIERRASLFWLEGRAEPRDSKAYYSPCIHATRRHPKVKGYRLANLLARSECSSSRMPVAIRWLILSALRAAGRVAWLCRQPFPVDDVYYTKSSLIAH